MAIAQPDFDRITQILGQGINSQPQEDPEITQIRGQIGQVLSGNDPQAAMQAGFQAMGQPVAGFAPGQEPKSFGDLYNQARAQKIESLKGLYGILNESSMRKIQQQQLDLESKKLGLSAVSDFWKMSLDQRQAITDAVQKLVPNEEARPAVMQWLEQTDQPVNASNADSMVAKGYNELLQQGKIQSPSGYASQMTAAKVNPEEVRHNQAMEGLTAQERAQQAASQAETARHNKVEETIGGAGLFTAEPGMPGAGTQNTTTGDAFLQTIPPQVAAQVKALSEGRMAFPAGFALKSPYWQKMLQMVSQYDPSFDAVNYNARVKTREDFSSGKSAQSINAMNTVIGHLGTLSQAADALNNGDIPAVNKALNYLSTATGHKEVKSFDTAKDAVASELTRVYRGMGGSEADIKSWKDQLDAAGSPEQIHGVVAQMGDLLESKISALEDQYNQGMGTTANPMHYVTDKSRAILDSLHQKSGENPSIIKYDAQGNRIQ